MTTRKALEIVPGIALLVLAYFFFTQSATLSDTKTALENANSLSTAVALALSDTEDSATQLAETANAESTESAMQLDDAYLAGTESAELASESENRIVATATESALQAANELSMMHSTITQNAELLSAFQVDATEFSNSSATQQAELNANAEATASNLLTRLDNSVNVAMTQDAQLDALSTTVHQQEIVLTELAPMLDTASSNSGDSSTIEVPDDFVLFSTNDFEMYVPGDFLVFDLETEQDEAINVFTSLGSDYDWMRQAAEAGTRTGIVIGASEKSNIDKTIDNLLILVEHVPDDISLEFYIESAINFLPRAAVINGQDVITVNGKDFGRIEYSIDLGGVIGYQLIYVAKSGNDFYLVFYTTYNNKWNERKLEFEASLASFEFLDD